MTQAQQDCEQPMDERDKDITDIRRQLAEDLSKEPFVIDEARRLDEHNAGAVGMAQSLLSDDGTGQMSPGPCADALIEWRRMKAEVTRQAERIAELEHELEGLPERCEMQNKLICELAEKLAAAKEALDGIEPSRRGSFTFTEPLRTGPGIYRVDDTAAK